MSGKNSYGKKKSGTFRAFHPFNERRSASSNAPSNRMQQAHHQEKREIDETRRQKSNKGTPGLPAD